MKYTYRVITLALALALATILSSCSFFKDVKDLVHAVKAKEEAGPQSQKQPEPAHEGALLDNKVTALRVQEALKRSGPEFAHVEVTGSAAGITMTGTVKSAADRARAEEIAKSVHRAMKLTNDLQIR